MFRYSLNSFWYVLIKIAGTVECGLYLEQPWANVAFPFRHQRRTCDSYLPNSLQQISYLGFICFRPEVQSFWPLARRSGPRNSFFRWFSSAIRSNLRHFQLISSCIHSRTCLRIVSNRINYNKSGPVCRIVSNRIISIMTCLDMFENRIKLHHKHYDKSGHVWELYQIAS